MFLTESWFWRGTQSAIFYYVSCAPLQEYKHKRQRRKDAVQSEREKAEIVTKQPGLILQPGPFQTNPQWVEEIMLGPGPPKKHKKAGDKYLKEMLKGRSTSECKEMEIRTEQSKQEIYKAVSNVPNPPQDQTTPESVTISGDVKRVPTITFSTNTPGVSASPLGLSKGASMEPMSPISEFPTMASDGGTSSDEPEASGRPRPSMERRLSNAVENIKDTIKGWNWKRYEREDEVLSGFQERLRGMWDRATIYGADGTGEIKKAGRKRAATNESERYEWERAIRNPEINEMHPPTVSKLPATREEAAWMLLPPPSRAVMEGKKKPQEETMQRWPLAVIGRNADELESLYQAQSRREAQYVGVDIPTRKKSLKSIDSKNSSTSWKTPDLSHSSSDEDDWSEEEDAIKRPEPVKRHSAPLGWTPIRPKAVAQPFQRPAQYWERSNA